MKEGIGSAALVPNGEKWLMLSGNGFDDTTSRTLHQRQLPDSSRHLTLCKLCITFVVCKKKPPQKHCNNAFLGSVALTVEFPDVTCALTEKAYILAQ
ncbi:MAG: hypothetical protein RM049_06065 [Nostoc sp. DedQUE04]|uniref:hypothetical protein n=1 Tax=Nostoc sp. DedQUE04 TaxID=3075390 RepID=UPI002AD4472D|nr:hypothetical protein [Nostoc sp. DedQUE04]MDZ8134853.1 hypothetical protein [Nostoc sp. DedQUE04]